MKVLLAASEVHPFAKTGGLADVTGALPRALEELDVEVAVCLPLYPKVRRREDPVTEVAAVVHCPFAGEDRPFRLLRTNLPGTRDVPVYLVENPWMFEAEEEFYGSEPGSYGDGHLRFLYFARALMKVPAACGFEPDVFHLNDWQTALVAPLLRTVHRDDPTLGKAASVITIHNLAYQGVFPPEDLAHAGLPGFLLEEGRLLENGLGNLLAGGIRFCDAISTVSRTYANEIRTEEFGNGLDALLDYRRGLVRGIVNGLDTDVWNPATDPHLPAHYTADDLEGKAACRRALLDASGLDDAGGPVFGCVSRLVAQKGLALVVPVMERVLDEDAAARLIVLGSGEPALENAFRELADRRPQQVHARLAFDAPFSSLVEAGSDLFLMPSRFEPCGLNQLISMRYGTPPIVRRTGGLKDTVTDAHADALAAGTATGFCFDAFSQDALADAVNRARELFRSPDRFRSVIRAGMESDWSWARSAREYVSLYEEAIERRRDGTHLSDVLSALPPEPLEIELPPLAAVPLGYARDVLVMVPFNPHTLFCMWELGGEASDRLVNSLTPADRQQISYELVLTNADSGHQDRYSVGGVTRQWFANVAPGNRYKGEVFLHAPRRSPVRVLDCPTVALPPDIGPDAV